MLNNNNKSNNNFNSNPIFQILHMVLICNSVAKGWRIKKIDRNRFELTKQLTDFDSFNFNLYDFINTLFAP